MKAPVAVSFAIEVFMKPDLMIVAWRHLKVIKLEKFADSAKYRPSGLNDTRRQIHHGIGRAALLTLLLAAPYKRGYFKIMAKSSIVVRNASRLAF